MNVSQNPGGGDPLSPRTPEQNDLIRRQRREQILDAALSVYVAKGYSATEIDDIAREAGIARGLIHYYFGSKQGLFEELTHWVQQRQGSLRPEITAASGNASALRRLLMHASDICLAAVADPRLLLFSERVRFDMPSPGGAGPRGPGGPGGQAQGCAPGPPGGAPPGERRGARPGIPPPEPPDHLPMLSFAFEIEGLIAEGMEAGDFRRGDPVMAANAFIGSLFGNLRELASRQYATNEAAHMVQEALSYCFEAICSRTPSWEKEWSNLQKATGQRGPGSP